MPPITTSTQPASRPTSWKASGSATSPTGDGASEDRDRRLQARPPARLVGVDDAGERRLEVLHAFRNCAAACARDSPERPASRGRAVNDEV